MRRFSSSRHLSQLAKRGSAIGVHVTHRHRTDDRGHCRGTEIDHIAVFGQNHVLRVHAGLDGDQADSHQMAVFAVDRHGA